MTQAAQNKEQRENSGNVANFSNHSPPTDTPPPDDEFKEGGYGWVVILGIFLLTAHTWGLNSAFAVFLAYYLKTDAFQATSLGYAFVGGLSISIALLISPLATYLAGSEYVGTQKTIFLGAIFLTIGFIGSSFGSQLWHLLLSQGVSFGAGMGLCFVASAAVPPQWFTKRRSFANAIGAAGSGFGGFIYSLATNAMITRIGLPWTFRVLAIVCFVVNGVASILIRDRNKAVGSIHLAFHWKLFKRPSFILFEAWAFLSMIAYTILVFSIVAYCQAVGLSSSHASLVGALFNLGQAIGRPLIGLSSDSVGRLNIANLCTLVAGLLCLFMWTFAARSLAGCIVFALLCGTVSGVIWATVAPVCAEVVGLALIPSGLSITWLVLVIPATFAEVIALSLRQEGSWGFLHCQLFTGFIYMGAFFFGWALRAWKVWELDQARLSKEQQDAAVRDDGVVTSATLGRRTSRMSVRQQMSKLSRGVWAYKRV
ncbi:MFS general substrate transporter [Xylariomycetidae sp. FL2044]|nr:MFS general substrate transporter [Xylariomycetidae sp. FL2044]